MSVTVTAVVPFVLAAPTFDGVSVKVTLLPGVNVPAVCVFAIVMSGTV